MHRTFVSDRAPVVRPARPEGGPRPRGRGRRGGSAGAGAAAVLEPLEPRRLMIAGAYTVIDLGTLGGTSSKALDINNHNVVVGEARNAAGNNRAFRFHDANGNGEVDPGEMQDLGVIAGHTGSAAFGVSDAGVIVGTSRSGAFNRDNAVRFDGGGVVADLGMGVDSVAYAVNASGTVVGGTPVGAAQHAFVRTAAGAVTTFALPGGAHNEARGINDAGKVVGYSFGTDGTVKAFAREANGTLGAIGFTPGTKPVLNLAWAVNASGQVAGEGYNGQDKYRAFRHANGAANDLGTVPGFTSSYGLGINARGDVVGGLNTNVEPGEGTTEAMAYDAAAHAIANLNDLVWGDTELVVTEATAINDNGYICGVAEDEDGRLRAVLLVPVPGVQGVQTNDGASPQRSKVNRLTVTFNSYVALLDNDAFHVTRRGAGGGPVPVTVDVEEGTTFTLTLDNLGPTGSVPDGVYDLTINGASVFDLQGNGAMSGNHQFTFHRLYSDADGDGDSDAADLSAFRLTLNKSLAANPTEYKWYTDFDGNGVVDANDLLQTRSRRTVVYLY